MFNRKKLIKGTLYVVSVVILVVLLENLGWWGLLIWIVSISLYRVWVMRDNLKAASRYIETMVWGKPLSKEFWKKGEMKNTKVEIYYKGKRIGGKKDGK
jgi:hypothetical protein